MDFKKHLLALLLFSLICLGFFFINLDDFFVSDDFDWVHLTANSDKPITSYFFSNYHGENQGGSYRPLMNLAFWVDYNLWNLNPLGYHLNNLTFYILTAWLIYLIVHKLSCRHSKRRLLAIISGTIFCLTPNHAEVAIWLSGRGDVISTFFYLLAFYTYINFRDSKKKGLLAVSLISFCLSLLAKEIAITLPALILIYEVFRASRDKLKANFKVILYPAVYALIVLVFFIIRYLAIGLTTGYYASDQLSFTLSKSYSMLLNLFSDSLLFFQTRLEFVYFFQNKHLIFLVALALLIYLSIKLFKKHQLEISFWWTFYFISMIPVAGLLFGIVNDEGERYNYLPSVAFSVILAMIIVKFFRKKLIFYPLLIITLSYFGYQTVQKSLAWQTASEVSKQIINDLPKVVSWDKASEEQIIAFALPDSYKGAHLLRNGFREGLELLYPGKDFNLTLLPISLLLDKDNLGRENIDWQIIEDGLFGTSVDGNFIVTSHLARKENDDYYFELWNYNYQNYTADTVKIKFKGEFLEKIKSRKTYFVTFNKGRLISLPLLID